MEFGLGRLEPVVFALGLRNGASRFLDRVGSVLELRQCASPRPDVYRQEAKIDVVLRLRPYCKRHRGALFHIHRGRQISEYSRSELLALVGMGGVPWS